MHTDLLAEQPCFAAKSFAAMRVVGKHVSPTPVETIERMLPYFDYGIKETPTYESCHPHVRVNRASMSLPGVGRQANHTYACHLHV